MWHIYSHWFLKGQQTPQKKPSYEKYGDVLGYWRHRSDCYFALFTTSLVVTTITFYNVRSSLPCWFFTLVGPLIAGFLVAALIWLRWSPPDVASPIGSFDPPDVSSLIDSFDLFWRCVSDRFHWSLLWRCVSDRLLWSPPDVASLIGSFDLLLTLRLWSVPLICLLTLRLWSVPLICLLTFRLWSTPLISSWRWVSDRFLWSASWRFVSDGFLWSAALTLRLWAAPLICFFLSSSTLFSRSSPTGARTHCRRVVFRLFVVAGTCFHSLLPR
jgi:hypothetical protein